MPATGDQLLLAIVVGALFAGGTYAVTRRNLFRFALGLVLLSNGVNLLIFTVGKPRQAAPPIVPEGAPAPVEATANALPQALVLTAIVIGFGLVAFTLVLILRSFETLGSVRTDELPARLAAAEGSEDSPTANTNGTNAPGVDAGRAPEPAPAVGGASGASES